MKIRFALDHVTESFGENRDWVHPEVAPLTDFSMGAFFRVVQIHPNKLLGLVGDHEDFPVEVMKVGCFS